MRAVHGLRECECVTVALYTILYFHTHQFAMHLRPQIAKARRGGRRGKERKGKVTDVIQLTLTLKMTTAQVVETPVTVNKHSPIQDYVHPEETPEDDTQPT